MLRLKASKTSLYKLVAEYEAMPSTRRVTFTKAHRTPDYWLRWVDADGLSCMAFFAACVGKPMLSIVKNELGAPPLSHVVHTLDVKDLLERGMVERFTTAAEHRRVERSRKHGGSAPATRPEAQGAE